MCNGVAGLLEERVVDLSTLLTDDLDIELLKRTPSSFLGSCRYKLPDWRDDEAVYKKLFAIALAFCAWDGRHAIEFVGLKNFVKLFTTDKIFQAALKNTVVYVIGTVPLTLARYC